MNAGVIKIAAVISAAVVLLFCAAIVFLLKGEVLAFRLNKVLITIIAWVFTVYMGFNVIINLLSHSRKERIIMGAVSILGDL